MKRTELKRATTIRASGKRMRSSRPKMTPARAAAKGQPCTLQFPGCTRDRETTVLCHLTEFGGGGMGLKPHDIEAVFGCHHCHAVMDGRITLIPELRHEVSHRNILWALIRTLRAQRAAGVLIYRGEE